MSLGSGTLVDRDATSGHVGFRLNFGRQFWGKMMMRQRPPEPAIKIGSYHRRELIGSGAFANVYLGCHDRTQNHVALKVIPKKSSRSPKELEAIRREIEIISALDHPLIVTLFEYIEDDFFMYLVLELATGDTLTKYITERTALSEPEALSLFEEFLSVLDYLHRDKQVIHRDIKSDNMIVDANAHIHLLDFGFANVKTAETSQFATMCGSPQWICPEMLKGQRYSMASDLWSTGILLYFMTVGSLPFTGGNLQQLTHNIMHNDPVFPEFLSPELRDLLETLLAKDPSRRPSIPRIYAHPWMQEVSERRLRFDDASVLRVMKVHDGISALDPGTLDGMVAFGYDVRGLLEDLQAHKMDERTGVYKLLRRKDVAGEIQNWRHFRANLGLLPRQPIAAGHSSAEIVGAFRRLPDGGTKPLVKRLGIRAGHSVFPRLGARTLPLTFETTANG
jgi:serine/threonine protein kinase